MKDNSLEGQIIKKLQFIPTSSQKEAILQLQNYLNDPSPYSLFILKGYAGTGKTALLSAVVAVMEKVGVSVELMASTGRASKVLSYTSGRPAHTIHRRIYRASAATPEEGGSFKLNSSSNKGGILFIVDEASMIGESNHEPTPFGSGNLLADLLAFVWNSDGCKLILSGDTAQLPPVGTQLSPALNAALLEKTYGMKIYEAELTDVVRQESESGILYNATMLRRLQDECVSKGCTDNISFALRVKGFGDVEAITGAELIETIDLAYRDYEPENCNIITYSNKRALAYNMGIRGQVLNYEEMLVRGERLMIARNNYGYAKNKDKSDFLANGETITVRRIHKYYDLYGLHFADATILADERDEEMEVRLLLSSLTKEEAQLSYNARERFYREVEKDYEHITSVTERRKAIKKDPFWGAIEVKYAYALTCHKAQGGQWPCVFIDMGFLSLLPSDIQLLRWLYTAITRASEKLYLVNTPKGMLQEQ